MKVKGLFKIKGLFKVKGVFKVQGLGVRVSPGRPSMETSPDGSTRLWSKR